MIKRFKIPDPVVFKVKQTDGSIVDETFTFAMFYDRFLMQNPRFEAPISNVRMALKISEAIEKAMSNGKVVELDDAHHEMLKDAALKPCYRVWGPQGPQVYEGFSGMAAKGAIQFLPFVDAIENATEDVTSVPSKKSK